MDAMNLAINFASPLRVVSRPPHAVILPVSAAIIPTMECPLRLSNRHLETIRNRRSDKARLPSPPWRNRRPESAAGGGDEGPLLRPNTPSGPHLPGSNRHLKRLEIAVSISESI
jgi:hypothetical protein